MATTTVLAVRAEGVEAFYACPAKELHASLAPLTHKFHIAMMDRLTRLLRGGNVTSAAKLAFILVMTHPDYWVEAQRAYAEAGNAFDKVVVSIALSDTGLGFAIGDHAAADRLFDMLGREAVGELRPEVEMPTLH